MGSTSCEATGEAAPKAQVNPTLSAKNQNGPIGAGFVFGIGYGLSTLFDQRRGAAASWRGSAAGATQSHSLRQIVRHSLSLRSETRECFETELVARENLRLF
jgi:hypothetical protein